jgi:hypothetical protein
LDARNEKEKKIAAGKIVREREIAAGKIDREKKIAAKRLLEKGKRVKSILRNYNRKRNKGQWLYQVYRKSSVKSVACMQQFLSMLSL